MGATLGRVLPLHSLHQLHPLTAQWVQSVQSVQSVRPPARLHQLTKEPLMTAPLYPPYVEDAADTLTLDDVAAALTVSRDTVLRLIRMGALDAVIVDSVRRNRTRLAVRPADFDAFLDSRIADPR